MQIHSMLGALGILVVLAPFSGLPSSWLDIALPLIGVLVMLSALYIRSIRQVRAEHVAPAPDTRAA